jgi:hypothetical protein
MKTDPPSPPATPVRPPRKRGASLRSEEKRVQATAMLARRLFGDKITEIADEFQVNPKTVYRRLSDARASGALSDCRSIIIESMLPKAMAVMQEALEGDDMKIAVQVALKIVDGLEALKGPDGHAGAAGTVEETLEHWRARRVTRVGTLADAVDGDLVDATPAAAPRPAGALSPAADEPAVRGAESWRTDSTPEED